MSGPDAARTFIRSAIDRGQCEPDKGLRLATDMVPGDEVHAYKVSDRLTERATELHATVLLPDGGSKEGHFFMNASPVVVEEEPPVISIAFAQEN